MSIVGPSLFGLVYMNLVATFPRSIFVLGFLLVFLSLVLLTFVRVPDTKSVASKAPETPYTDLESVGDDTVSVPQVNEDNLVDARRRKMPTVVVTVAE